VALACARGRKCGEQTVERIWAPLNDDQAPRQTMALSRGMPLFLPKPPLREVALLRSLSGSPRTFRGRMRLRRRG